MSAHKQRGVRQREVLLGARRASRRRRRQQRKGRVDCTARVDGTRAVSQPSSSHSPLSSFSLSLMSEPVVYKCWGRIETNAWRRPSLLAGQKLAPALCRAHGHALRRRRTGASRPAVNVKQVSITKTLWGRIGRSPQDGRVVRSTVPKSLSALSTSLVNGGRSPG